jgi:ribonuclease D
MLDYALSDVTGLLDLADTMIAELERRGLRDEFERRNAAALDKERNWDPLPNFTRIPGFGRMSREKRRRAKVLWYAREYYARGSDRPPRRWRASPSSPRSSSEAWPARSRSHPS